MKARLLTAGVAGLLAASGAYALEFRSVGDSPAVLYDGPSRQAHRVWVVSPGAPVEVLSSVEGWTKIRTHTGQLAWAESASISGRRTVVAAQDFSLLAGPDAAAPPVAQVRQGVILELLEVAGAWVKARHREGVTGYVRLDQVWGT